MSTNIPGTWRSFDASGVRPSSWVVLRALLLVFGTIASLCLGRFYGLVALSLTWAPYVFFHPQDGLWVSPAFLLTASLISPPAGFVEGVGYSPELTYWAIGVCVLFIPMLVRYVEASMNEPDALSRGTGLRGFCAFTVISVIAAVTGIWHGYSVQNVAKQFFGLVLLLGYFLFALRFAPTREDIEQIMKRVVRVAVLASVVFIAFYFSVISIKNFSSHLSVVVAYDGALFVFLVPQILCTNSARIRIDRKLLIAVFLFVIPVLAQLKRVVGACLLCALLAWFLRSASRRMRYAYVIAAPALLAVVLTTGVLNPIGAWFAKYEDSDYLIPEDVENHYSVITRLAEFNQVMESLHGVPVFGNGLGSTLTWYDPFARTYWDQETADNGLLYLLAKMGIAGTVAFVWFIYPLGSVALRKPLNGLHLSLFLLFVFHLLQMIADVTFFYFMTAGWVGTTCAFLYILNNSETTPGTARP
jgi:hypothetical protein